MKTYDNNLFWLVLAYFTNLAVHSLADLIIINYILLIIHT